MSLTLARARQRAGMLSVESYDVRLDLTDTEQFRSRTTVRFGCSDSGAASFAELADAISVTATLNGRPVSYADGRVLLPDLAHHNVLEVEARLPYVTNGDGMHTFTDPADGERYVSAYCGMDVASRVFCCFDQPDLKATISLAVDADPAWAVLANGRELRRWGGHVEFARTPRIPPYLFVVCAGPWASVRFRHGGREFGWHARRSLAVALERDADDLREITTRCFDHYADVFEPPYAFDSYDQVFVPGLNWGAQEQPGCVIHRDEYLPPAPPSAPERMWRATVIAHEMAHMWFGDLVTMRWWEDSWLNESFADYMGYQVAEDAAAYAGSWVWCALLRKPTAYDADTRRSSHPVAEHTAKMTDVDTAFGNFDMITYAKGNAVLRQLVTWLGERDFLAGVNAYLREHAFGNADLGDFIDALAGATDRDVRGWAESWLRTTGYDGIRVTREDGVPVLHREGSRPHRFHVAAYDDEGVFVEERLVGLDDEPVPLAGWAGLAVLPNNRDETYARLVLDERSLTTLRPALARIKDPLARAVIWASTLRDVEQGDLDVGGLLELASTQLADESDPLVLGPVFGQLADVVRPRWLSPSRLVATDQALAALARRRFDASDHDVRRAGVRLLAVTATSDDDLSVLRDLADADAELRWQAIARCSALGRLDDDQIAAELAREPSATGDLGAMRARAARPDGTAKAEAWSRMLADGTSNREFEALSQGLWQPGQEELTAAYTLRYVAECPDLARRRGQAFSKVIGRCFPWLPLPEANLLGLRAALSTKLANDDVPTVLRRSWNDRLDDLDVALRVRGIAGSGVTPSP